MEEYTNILYGSLTHLEMNGVLDGLPEVLAALDVSDFTKLNWFNKPHLAFDKKDTN